LGEVKGTTSRPNATEKSSKVVAPLVTEKVTGSVEVDVTWRLEGVLIAFMCALATLARARAKRGHFRLRLNMLVREMVCSLSALGLG